MRHIVIEPGRDFLEALRLYRRGAEHLLSGSVSETQFSQLYDELMRVAQRVGELRPVMVDLPKDFEVEIPSQEFLKHEFRTVADTFGISTDRAIKIILRADLIDISSSAPNAMIQALAENHAAFIASYKASMLKERSEKKKRRKQVVASLELGLAGAVVVASNAMTIGYNPYVKESIALGAGLVVKATYDIRKG